VKFQQVEKRVSGGHGHMDEEFERFWFDIIGGLDLEEDRWVVDEESHPIFGSPVNYGVKDFLDGIWGD